MTRALWFTPALGSSEQSSLSPPRSRGIWVGGGAAQAALPLRARDAEDAGARTDALDDAPPWQRQQFFAGLNYVGQVHRTYLVCEAADELILIDQHAAHERVA